MKSKKTIEWTINDDELSAAVVPEPDGGCTLLSVDADGTLLVQGDKWKECLLIRRRNCKRSRNGMDRSKCCHCVRSGRAHIGDRKTAIGVAEALAEGIVNGTM